MLQNGAIIFDIGVKKEAKTGKLHSDLTVGFYLPKKGHPC
jgi:hypothetical protein